MNFCNGFKAQFVNDVCNHAHTRVIGDVMGISMKKPIAKCTYCELVFNGRKCSGCKMAWCGREYYCERPESLAGIVFTPCVHICDSCTLRCKDCNIQINDEDCCTALPVGYQCQGCMEFTCKEHISGEFNSKPYCKKCSKHFK
jgi:hypothetical protein